MVPKFARTMGELEPATAGAGNQGTKADLRAAAAAALTAGDTVARWWVNGSGAGVGLRGGDFSYTGKGNRVDFQMTNSQWVEDLAVSGTIAWELVKPGAVHASVTFMTPAGAGSLQIDWHDREPQAQATMQGSIGGRKIVASMGAP